MKLHPQNPTPGYLPRYKQPMIKFQTVDKSFVCLKDERPLGYLRPDDHGFFHYFPNRTIIDGWTSSVMKEIAFKLDALNLPQAIEATD